MKAKVNLPNKTYSKENKKLKEIIKFLIERCKTQREQIKLQKQMINNHEEIKKLIKEILAKHDTHFIGFNDEEFQKYQENKYLR